MKDLILSPSMSIFENVFLFIFTFCQLKPEIN